MSATEYRVIHFFTDSIENGNFRIPVFSGTVCLYGFYTGFKGFIDLIEEIRFDKVICIQDDDDIVFVGIEVVYGKVERFGF